MRKSLIALAFAASPALAEEVVDGPGPNLVIEVAGAANGQIVIDMADHVAPNHVAQMVALAKSGAYDGVVFHRVIDGFMAQTGDVSNGKTGGDLSMAGTGGSDLLDLKAEFSDLAFARGVVGMARAASPDSANSQFFIMFDQGDFLNGQYTVVGKVISGMEVVDAIQRGEPPETPDVMTKVTVQE
ncbi:peptidylprolyl isomerase [Rhodobacteraceae bacterium KMS-5]|uniref:Peptidyl-prolyl cis-trans isomerase n=1 Tax=Tabrizicola oligotrophica TaxID=2710650 RepID=A0A6M0QP66_9RHOB|nr:peptidylprolyl isomerase [Tabrizicola oligotrophica]NEY89278.1 peptidylprolyl isomerase [Tabrizicola oligotrophica]